MERNIATPPTPPSISVPTRGNATRVTVPKIAAEIIATNMFCFSINDAINYGVNFVSSRPMAKIMDEQTVLVLLYKKLPRYQC